VSDAADSASRPANLTATAILDFHDAEVQRLASEFAQAASGEGLRLRRAHRHLVQFLRPVYSVDESRPASVTLRERKGSCSQRIACLEAIARALGIPTRVRGLHVSGSFWYPRFPLWRGLIPRKILLLWPQFFLGGSWVDFDEIHGAIGHLAAASAGGFTNAGESLFEAVQHSPVDFFGKTCGLACAPSSCDLSKFVLADEGFFDARDEAIARFGNLYRTMRGRTFEFFFGGRTGAP
jgi:transglutaminase-like putative cysteine protease